MILRLAEAGVVVLVLGRRVREELEAVFQEKAPDLIADLAIVIDCCRPELCGGARPQTKRRLLRLVGHPADAAVLAEAWDSRVDYFVTLDKAHMLKNSRLRRQAPFPIGTPGDCLAWINKRIREQVEQGDHFF